MSPLHSLIDPVLKRVLERLVPGDPNRNGSSYALTVITPICPGRAEALSTALSALARRQRSPFHAIPDVQFARWMVIDQLLTDWKGAPVPPSTLNSQYLLFSADLTAPASRADLLPQSFFRELATRIPHVCHTVWGECRGCPDPRTGPDEFVDYLARSKIEIGLYYAAFPNLTGDDIGAALNVREELARFARDHQHEMLEGAGTVAHRKLQIDFETESPRWIL